MMKLMLLWDDEGDIQAQERQELDFGEVNLFKIGYKD